MIIENDEISMTAIYARQSVDKKDSVSIDSQINICRKEVPEGMKAKIYSDKGYTGANTDRPQFQALMQDIAMGRVNRLIVYKLDRISRSLLDFSEIMEILRKNKVEFVSMTEKFDTSSEIGRAMFNIVMVFAQLERETIQKRVRDNFYERGKKGLFLAGYAPVGYVKVETYIDGIRTYKLQADLKTAPLVKCIFQKYLVKGTSVGSIVKEINADFKSYGLDKPLNNVRVSRILRNPVYVRADVDVYNYLKNKGAVHDNDISEFDGIRGCTVYGERKSKTTSKFTDLTGDHVQLNLHEGLIEAENWLKVQYKMDSNKQLKNTGKGSHSWLSGIVKCGYCGLALTVVSGQKNGRRYINCGGRKQKICYDRKQHITFDELEKTVESQLTEYMRNYHYIRETNKNKSEVNRVKIRLQDTENQIENVVEKMLYANKNMISYLNREIDRLEIIKEKLSDELSALSAIDSKETHETEINSYISEWDKMSIEEKKFFAGLFIRSVYVTDNEININWCVPMNDEK